MSHQNNDLPSKAIRWFIGNFSKNSSRVHFVKINAEFAQSIAPGSRVLDAASGSQPYRHLLDHCLYESADFEQSNRPYAPTTHVCDLTAIPVESEHFDAILFNQGLEHMPDPLAVLNELHRVLKPGGRILCTAPFFYEEHEQPYDFYRYTQFAYQHMFPSAGFRIERLEWLEGYLGTVAYQLDGAAKNLPPSWRYLPLRIVFAILSVILYRTDIRHKYTATGHPKNYAVLGIKPMPSANGS
ncbi:SAM-dependent methyltransferase [Croceicoccus ponticola]|uniref:SAM-dependent methyltransferase n=1 Tax=Croceicoccus ponticola TaxID=2217664 RepID=A0A437GVN1_9SPHN|nr:class I SAM-dependent methyltransferase [Croceicoccus ponticola]RVQ65799.1 SAM-dependent methyltransferase [Croceicoccus ponticola]